MRIRQTKYSGNSFWSDVVLCSEDLVASNLDTAETYTEDTPLNLTNIVIDGNSDNVTARLTLSNLSAGTLSTATSGSVTSTFSSGVWTASGAVADVNTLLAGLSFTPASNFNSSFSIAVHITNGQSVALTNTKAFTGIVVNDTPMASNLSAAETYTEDTSLNLTDIVISDVDSTNVTATLTLSSPSAGTLNTATSGDVTSSYNGGTGVWTATGLVANVNVLLAGLTFTPAANYNSSFTIATSISDGTTSVTGSKIMTGVPVNDAPVLDASRSPVLANVAVNADAPTGAVGTLVSSLVDLTPPAGQVDNVSDIESNTPGIALVAADSTNGTWYYSINNGSTWNALGVVSTASARLLAPSARLYFKPTTDFTGTITAVITFRAWDQTSGTNGVTANTTASGGSTAFSTATDTANITVS